jgi:uncharacterized protein (DUF983 family)
MLKDTKIYSIINNKCPKCHQGDFFIDKHAYNLKTFIKMHEKCTHCREIFDKEVGFYYGAMYVSYGLNITYGIGLFLVMVLLLKLNVLVFLFSFLGLVVVIFQITMRI